MVPLQRLAAQASVDLLDSESSLDGLDLGLYEVLSLADVPGTQAATSDE